MIGNRKNKGNRRGAVVLRFLPVWLGMAFCFGGCGESPVPVESVFLPKMQELSVDEPASENLADLLQKKGAAMMAQVRAGELLGSGVIYGIAEEKLMLLTAGHVVADPEAPIQITFFDGYETVCDSCHRSETADLAILRVDLGAIPHENLQNYICARVDKERFDSAAKGERCIALGCRTAVAAEAYEGRILDNWIYMEDYGQYMLWAKAPGKAGMSGGGLFDEKGYLLGILSGIGGEDELAVVPLSFVLAELENELDIPNGMVENKVTIP